MAVDSFDRRARSYEHDWRSRFHAQVVAGSAEVALWAMPHPATVLDVGCGTGALLRPLAALGRRRDRMPTAAELEVMLARARLVPIAWGRIYDLGPLPLVRAVVAACS